MWIDDYGSRAPMTCGDHKEFRTSHSDIGLRINSKRFRSLEIKDPSLNKMEVLAKEDPEYCHLEKNSELRMLRGDYQN